MSDARSTYRYAAMIAGGSVLVVGAVIVSNMDSAKTAPSADSTSAAEARQPDESAFAQWADDDSADGKGRLIGEIERDGKMVELRQLPDGAGPEQAGQDLPPDELAPDQSAPSR